MPKCIELLPCDWLISNLCYQAIKQVYLIKWPVRVYGTLPESQLCLHRVPYISLLIIPCIIYHVTNKETLNLAYIYSHIALLLMWYFSYNIIFWGKQDFFKEIITFFHGCNWSKVTVKTFIMLQNIYALNKCGSFEPSLIKLMQFWWA